ncbi:NmrA family NAD(P)-binding protein [Amycolatopsis magusensis]|uniref:NmrA family NAD(P)-binding protein n=1 Tax=Amycolatopsis magusensis TaxID=882444 RepID=UPI0024A7B90E|nr:NAD(P)H-binding protein [Amycolatopsis magusensis]MDI5979732.1 NAD(P)H-binding protein [Amycolatopsis magusensis]
MITVLGATGNTGGKIAELLLAAGEPVRTVGRSAERLEPLRAAGAELAVGDAGDAEFLTEAFRGADAVYTLLHTAPDVEDFHAEQDRKGEAIVEAIRRAGVRHVVSLSSVGAERPSGTGFITSLHTQERRLRELENASVLLLRPGAFFENFHAVLGLIKEAGVNADSVAPEAKIPMIAARDIAEVAADALRKRDWTGVVVRELLGERDLSYLEATRILGEAIGLPQLPYVPMLASEMVETLRQAGFSANSARLHVEMTAAFSDGTVAATGERTAANSTPTRFEDFVPELAHAYRQL